MILMLTVNSLKSNTEYPIHFKEEFSTSFQKGNFEQH